MLVQFHDQLPRPRVYLRKQLRYLMVAFCLIAFSLSIGTAGYMFLAHLSLTDAFLNASMIMGGMGPVDPMPSNAAKWFSSFYALYSGVALLTIVAAMFTPTIHRLLHRLHLKHKL